mmetsp:Transcript_16444/g.39273  ORF Transcript_16444/g.39273 Transcript_16444/m.39273 type:complete len:263 (+) Transcript_16444:354-1142(+)
MATAVTAASAAHAPCTPRGALDSLGVTMSESAAGSLTATLSMVMDCRSVKPSVTRRCCSAVAPFSCTATAASAAARSSNWISYATETESASSRRRRAGTSAMLSSSTTTSSALTPTCRLATEVRNPPRFARSCAAVTPTSVDTTCSAGFAAGAGVSVGSGSEGVSGSSSLAEVQDAENPPLVMVRSDANTTRIALVDALTVVGPKTPEKLLRNVGARHSSPSVHSKTVTKSNPSSVANSENVSSMESASGGAMIHSQVMSLA